MSYTSTSDDEVSQSQAKLLGRQRPTHAVLGRRIADVLLWRDTKVSTSVLIAITTIWFLVEVVGYSFLPLVCHIVITTMILNFIYNKLAENYERLFNQLVDIASGSNLQAFLLTIVVLYIISVIGNYVSFINRVFLGISVIGNYVSFVNLVFLGCLYMLTLPYLYERYEEDVHRLFGDVSLELKRIFRSFDRKVLNRNSRGRVKEKKYR